jgi:3-hydroxyisobutyrate dehydrogenase-like beta-hydroxyacid dehydrogenase
MNVAWIGLGHMGLPTAKTVAAAGHTVKGYDIRPPAPEDADGLILTGSAREAAEGCEVLCLAVFSDEQVENVLAGPDGVFQILRNGAVVAIFTTGTLDALKSIVACAPPGVAILDTCFSRQRGNITSGMLNLLVGGDGDALERCRPVLSTFAHEIYHVGGSGAGRSLKLVNNVLWASHVRLAIDAMHLAEKLGLEPTMTARIVHECSGASDVLGAVFVHADAAERVEFMQPYLVKDASAAAEAADEVGADLGALGDVVRAITGSAPTGSRPT